MGFEFRINEIESTYKPVSFCMYQALKITNHFKDDDCTCTIKPQELAVIIIRIENILDCEKLTDKAIKAFRFYDDETEKDIREHLEEANKKFKDALVWSIAYKEDYLSASCL